jgi:hypothetical protein
MKNIKALLICIVVLFNLSCNNSEILVPAPPVIPGPDDQYSRDAQFLAARLSSTTWIDSVLTAEIENALVHARSVRSDLASLHLYGDFVLNRLVVEPSSQVAQKWSQGILLVGDNYLDSLATLYRLDSAVNTGWGWFILYFHHSLNMPKLAKVYAQSPSIVYAEPDYFVGDGDQIFAMKKSGNWDFVFSHGEGDCPAGCIWRNFVYVVVPPSHIAVLIQERVPPLLPEIYLWNIPPRFIATLYSSAQDILNHYRDNNWWKRQHAIEVTWRLIVNNMPWELADAGSNRTRWDSLHVGLLARKSEVLGLLTSMLFDPDQDVRASAELAISKISQ